jgi:2-polyprenyl-3-methyl-5-hydroxy-6-metoxy-1,4-benzoquinol methylase
MTEARIAYDEWHDAREVDVSADSPWHLLVRAHLDLSRDVDGREVLEIGCGRGGFSCWIAGHGRARRQVAIDYSEAAVQKARQYAESRALGVVWQVGDIQSIAYPDASFDTIVSCETIEHVPDPFRAIRELFRVLKPGGRLFLTTPNYFGTLGLYRGYLRARGRTFTEVGQPINQFTMTPRTLLWLRQSGYQVRVIDGVGHYVPFPGRPPIRLAVLDRGRVFSRWLALHSFFLAEKPCAPASTSRSG